MFFFFKKVKAQKVKRVHKIFINRVGELEKYILTRAIEQNLVVNVHLINRLDTFTVKLYATAQSNRQSAKRLEEFIHVPVTRHEFSRIF